MSKLYLHKKESYGFTTNKDTIIADMDELKDPYVYKKSIFNFKKPKELVVTSKFNDDFYYETTIHDLPVERVIIDAKQLDSHNLTLYGFDNCKELIVTSNCGNVNIASNFGLKHIEQITIPYNINNFKNTVLHSNKLNKITIKDDKGMSFSIPLDEYKKDGLIIYSYNNGESLILTIFSKYKDVKYTCTFKDNKISFNKKYIRRRIDGNEEELNLIELKKQYNCELDFDRLECKKIILNKEDLNILCKYKFNRIKLKEIKISDNNEMLLMPKNILIKLNYDESINRIEEYKNSKGIFFIEILNLNNYKKRYIVLNEHLDKFEIFKKTDLKELYFDCDTNILYYDENLTKLVIPITKEGTITDLEVLKHFVSYSERVFLKKNNEIIELIKTPFINEISFYNKDSFKISYTDELIRKVNCTIYYSFNPEDNHYYRNLKNKLEIETELREIGKYKIDLPRMYSSGNYLSGPKSDSLFSNNYEKPLLKVKKFD